MIPSTRSDVHTKPPFITVSGIPNFRDVGGYPISSPADHSIRREVIYRCAEPSKVTEAGISTIRKLGITHIYDLRSNNEIERNRVAGIGGIVEWEGCERVFVPVFEDQDYSPEALAERFRDYASGSAEGFTRAYGEILNGGPKSYRTILLHLAYEPEKPLIVHCTAGKDRTGVICALVLSLCGVDDEVVAHEYALTDLGLPKEWKDGAIAHLIGNTALNVEGAKNLISSKAESMMSTLKMIQEKFGGPEGYIMERCGLTKEEVEKIKRNLIVEEPAVHLMAQSVDK
ncbi:hypothetical protein LZ554_008978 [Drepanopeziza brunnea f. sp. 'monogermtubi']|nr:hypothetical protein LZ554_008978 [Drepanopeziza brunnea f. sp. 'monogermtubi']